MCCSVLQCVCSVFAMCCSVLQCVAVCCSVLQWVKGIHLAPIKLRHAFRKLCCSVLQCVAVGLRESTSPPSNCATHFASCSTNRINPQNKRGYIQISRIVYTSVVRGDAGRKRCLQEKKNLRAEVGASSSNVAADDFERAFLARKHAPRVVVQI